MSQIVPWPQPLWSEPRTPCLSCKQESRGETSCRDRECKAWDEAQPNPREPGHPIIVPIAVHELEPCLSGRAVAQGSLGEKLAYLAFPVLAE